MEKQPFFTIGIPVYNTSRWVGECIESILSQSFDDFEIICVNDGSTDNSIEILQNYSQRDNRIKIINRENGGVSRARNTVFYNATGMYVYIIDSDDQMCPDVLLNTYNQLTAEGYPDLLQAACKYVFPDKNNVKYWNLPPEECFVSNYTKDERTVVMWLNNCFSILIGTKFFKREFILKYGLSFTHFYTAYEDSDFTFEVNRKADTFAFSQQPAYCYILRDSSISYSFSEKYFYSMLNYWKNFYYNIYKWNISDSFKEKVREKENEFLCQYRDYILSAFNEAKSKEDVFIAAAIIEEIFGKQIKSLPLSKVNHRNNLFYILYRCIGIVNTAHLLYHYLKLRRLTDL